MKDPTPKDQPDRFTPYLYPIKEKQKLARTFRKKNIEFLDVLFSRRSNSRFSKLNLREIAEVLHLCTKVHSISADKSGFITTKRTAPSAGARHPVDLLVSLPEDTIDKRILSYYNSIDHSLSELLIKEHHLREFLNDINENIIIKDTVIIWFSIQTKKTSSKYTNPASLYWKDTGALLYCIQLISTYLGYKSCPLGKLASDSFKKLFGTQNLVSGGGILIGK